MKRPILIVEDSQFDVEFMLRRLEKNGIETPLIQFKDGKKAFNYLSLCNRPNTAVEHIPIMMIIDINLPGVGGKSLLHYAKRASRLKLIPVVMLSTSSSSMDIEHCYKMGANSFVAKSTDRKTYEHAISNVFNYWLRTTLMPTHHV